MCGLKVPKIMEVILLVGNFDRAIFVSVCGGGGEYFFTKKSKLGRFRNSKPNFRRLSRLVMLCLIHVSLLSRQC